MKPTLYLGDCLEVLSTLEDNSVDAIVTDPPYHLTSVVERFGKKGAKPAQFGSDGLFARASRGFMGKEWDGGDISFRPETWAACLRVLKPGGHLVAFGGTRTIHRITAAVEDAGFEIRDMLLWLYGSGFPKSHDQGNGWGTALKPANEPICLARKPFKGSLQKNIGQWGTGALNIDACRVESTDDKPRWPANVMHDGLAEEWSRYFYCPKASKADREEGLDDFEPTAMGFSGAQSHGEGYDKAQSIGLNRVKMRRNTHPTVKPTELMQWLCRLVTPEGGTVLDPFMGSGSTGKACRAEGFRFIGIEREEEYMKIAQARLGAKSKAATKKSRESGTRTLSELLG